MKWILIVTIWTGASTGEERKVPGWSSKATCERAAMELIHKHADDVTQEVRAHCIQENQPLVLPQPR